MNAAASRRIAQQVGCTLIKDGKNRLLWECNDPATVVKLLSALADEDAKHPMVRALARRLFEASGRNPKVFARNLHKLILDRVEWRREQPETFRHTLFTLRHGYGDCDDMARAIKAISKAAGVPARMVILNNTDGEPAHAVSQLNPAGDWRWLETSIDARYGEHPLKAARRLGIYSRLNMKNPKLGACCASCAQAAPSGLGEFTVGIPTGSDGYIISAALGSGLGPALGGSAGAVLGAAWPGVSVEQGWAKGASWGAGLGGLAGLWGRWKLGRAAAAGAPPGGRPPGGP